jgi:hypothetical protein
MTFSLIKNQLMMYQLLLNMVRNLKTKACQAILIIKIQLKINKKK